MPLSEELRLSVPRMDREHTGLLQTAAELRRTLNSSLPHRQKLNELLHEFSLVVAAHFVSEEELMKSRGYHAWRAHVAEHKRLFGQLKGVENDFANGAINPCESLALFVDVWIARHIQGPDRDFAEYLKTLKSATTGQAVPGA
jgi:hemerythrin-like metal-binding protein